MKANEVIRGVMKDKKMKYSALANTLGIKQNVLSERLSQDNISIKKLLEMLTPLDCEIIVRDKTTGDEWTVDE
ncbi:MAG: helix-turn-helix domain-containing protein [Clostridiales bacterium]|nr:helix-turn-helix domain-containing protein [Clostridiales bacterium]